MITFLAAGHPTAAGSWPGVEFGLGILGGAGEAVVMAEIGLIPSEFN